MAEFVGTYKYESDDGKFDDFLKALNVNFVTRKVAGAVNPKVEISCTDDGTITFKTTSTFKDTELTFKLGEEIEEKRMDGVVCKTVFTKDGNKLIQEQKSDTSCTIIREFVDNKMTVTCKCNNVTTVRNYSKV